MKFRNIYPINVALLSFIMLGLLIITGCDITNPTDGVKTKLNTKTRTTTVSILFLDARTGQPIGYEDATPVHAQISGNDSNNIIDLFNRPKTEFTASNGFLSFAINDAIIPGKGSDQVEFNVLAQAPGYITTAQPVTIDHSGGNSLEIRMVNRNRLPAGVTGESSLSVGSLDQNGSTSDAINFASTENSEVNNSVSVKVNENTIITDENGRPLTGQITADYNVFNTNEESAIQSFPGGLSPKTSNAPDGSDRLSFKPAGLFSLEIKDENNNYARQFDQPLQIGMEIDSDFTNHSGESYTHGDEIEVWSFDTETGLWSFESTTNITEGTNNKLKAKFEVPHLSYWTVTSTGAVCEEGVTLNLSGSNQQIKAKYYEYDTGDYLGSATSRKTDDGYRVIELKNTPDDVDGKIKLFDMNDNLIKTLSPVDLCSNSIDVDVSSEDELTVTFEGKGVCSDGSDIEVHPSFPAYFKLAGNSSWTYAGEVEDGSLEVTFPTPGDYLLGADYEEEFYEYEFDLNDAEDGDLIEKDIELPQNVCDDV